ncbi:MAG: AAA family ATPase, partial [Lachnospiraceae bacterium]|nr:AAA family ATPase [Lachnospiraceae bacterium]
MLQNLHIKNMALIDEIDIDFTEGLNILTGETGAGKSIILGAVNIALGGRTGKEMLREHAEYGLVELMFDIRQESSRLALEALDIPLAEDSTLIISRRIYPNRVVNKVNDELVTVSKLKEIAGI